MPARPRRVALSLTATAAALGGLLVAAAPPVAAAPGAGGLTAAGRGYVTAAATTGALTPRLATVSRLGKTAGAAQVAAAVGLAVTGPGSLRRDAAGRVLVDVLVDDAAGFATARAAGLDPVAQDASLATVTGWITPAALTALGAAPHVRSAAEVLTPMTATDPAAPAAGADGTATATGTAAAAGCRPVVDEADTQLGAAAARSTYGVDGTGVTVGVLSDSYDRASTDTRSAAQDVRSGDLPGRSNPCGRTTPVKVVDDTASGGADEGRAMLQHVHDLAPGSTLAFATAFNGLTSFAANITRLVRAGATVLSDDVTYFNEPFFQAGPIDQAVAAAQANGATFFSSAANNNIRVAGRDVGSYEAPAFRPVPCGGTVVCHDFNPRAGQDINYGYLVPAGSAVALDLQWDEPWYGVTDDFDIQLQDVDGNVVASSTMNNLQTQQPFEFLRWDNATGADAVVFAYIARIRGAGTPRLKTVEFGNGATVSDVEYRTGTGGDLVGPQIFGHNGGPATVSLAAVPYDDATTPEQFSSPGPVTLYHGPVRGTRPAAALATPTRLAKPDVAATDGAATTFFAQLVGRVWRFYGTSAASPHAAAVAALMRDADPTLTPDRIAALLRSTASPIANGSVTRSGAGLVNAVDAVTAVQAVQAVGATAG